MRKQSNVTSGTKACCVCTYIYACAMPMCIMQFHKKDAGGEKGMRAVDEKLAFTKYGPGLIRN